jgi:hypothetical protein
MVRLTDSHAEALALVGTGTLTRTQVESILEVFTHRSEISQIPFYFTEGALSDVSFSVYAYTERQYLKLASVSASCDTDIEPIVRMFIHSETWKDLQVELVEGHDHWDYQLSFKDSANNVFGGFFFTLSRIPIEIVD